MEIFLVYELGMLKIKRDGGKFRGLEVLNLFASGADLTDYTLCCIR